MDQSSHDRIQKLVDQAANFNLYVIPDGQTSGGGRSTGIRASHLLRRFDIDTRPPDSSGIRAVNTIGENLGRLDVHWRFMPESFSALPGKQPPPTRLDPSKSQRFTMLNTEVHIGDGTGFRSFGAGRTFPFFTGGAPKLVACAIGNVTEGFGQFRGNEGNFTMCGEISAERGFDGHIMIRLLDSQNKLRTAGSLPPIQRTTDPVPGVTYLTYIGQKGKSADQENSFSLDPAGQVRGLNIPVDIRRVVTGCTLNDGSGFRALDLAPGEVIAREIGFGKGSIPNAPPTGTALNPFQFEGVSEYLFKESGGQVVGSLVVNVLEGRRFDVRLPAAPQEPALRFGFFGHIVVGKGIFAGVQGMLYGASGSVFHMPPDDHVISNWYVGRIFDPDGRYRAAAGRG
jgi:hypothetical protein